MADIRTVTPAEDTNLLTLEQAKAVLGIAADDTSMDETVTFWIEATSGAIQKHVGRTFAVVVVDEYFKTDEWQDLPPGLLLWVRPVVEVQNVSQGGADVDDGEFRINDAGVLWNGTDGAVTAWGRGPIIVRYAGGYETLPADVVLAATRFITDVAAANGRDSTVKTETVEDVGEIQYGTGAGSWNGVVPALPDNVTSLLTRYMRVSV